MKITRLVAVTAGALIAFSACSNPPPEETESAPVAVEQEEEAPTPTEEEPETVEAPVEEEKPSEEPAPVEDKEETVEPQEESPVAEEEEPAPVEEESEDEAPEYSGDDEDLGEATPTEAVRESKFIGDYECRPTPYDNYEFAAVISMNAYDGVEIDFESGYGVYDSAGNYTEYAVIDSNHGPLVYFLGNDGETLLAANHNAWDYTFIPNDEEAGLPPIVDRESGAYLAAEQCV